VLLHSNVPPHQASTLDRGQGPWYRKVEHGSGEQHGGRQENAIGTLMATTETVLELGPALPSFCMASGEGGASGTGHRLSRVADACACSRPPLAAGGRRWGLDIDSLKRVLRASRL